MNTGFVLPCIDRQRRGSTLLLAYAGFVFVYLGAAWLGEGRAVRLEPGFVDAAIPRLDWTVWVYMSQIPFLAGALWFGADGARSRVLAAAVLATLVAAAIFIVFPTTLARRDDIGEGPTEALWSLLYLFDAPTNAFPSLHVALAALATRAPHRGWPRSIAVVWACVITLSTLTTGQHLVIDVLGGLVLAACAWSIARRLPVAETCDD